jgi:hypothetical protein
MGLGIKCSIELWGAYPDRREVPLLGMSYPFESLFNGVSTIDKFDPNFLSSGCC